MRYGFRVSLALATLLVAGAAAARAQEPNSNGKPKELAVASAVCAECHQKSIDNFLASDKGKLFLLHPRSEAERGACVTCHGATQTHVESGGEDPGGMITFARKDRTPLVERNTVCLNCHERTARMFWKGSAHDSREVGCTGCHALMTENSERGHLKRANTTETCAQCHPQRAAQQLRSSHMPLREGKMECTSCHNPHGSPNDKLLHSTSVNDACYSCHTEKRGPFLWEHAPVVENCSNCHDPHGNNHEKMLKTPKPRLCQQCHDETRHPTTPQKTTSTRFVMGRQCTNCHFNIHGSNHPSGQAFTR